MSVAESIQWVVRGLGNNRYRDYLGPLMRYKRPAELLPHLITASDYIHDKTTHSNTNLDRITTNSNRNYNNLSKNRTTTKSTLVCFRCREEKRTSKNCSKKPTIVCFRCSEPGHKANECNGKSKVHQASDGNSGSTGKPINQPVLQLGTSAVQKKYYKDAIINSTCIRAYVDMGASCVAMKKSEVDRLEFEYDETIRDEFIGYGFGRVKSLGRFETDMNIDGVCAHVTINVVPDETQEIALLVGHPFMEQAHVKITSTTGKLKIEEIIPIVAENQMIKTPMWANDAVVIPKNHIGHISVSTNFYSTNLCVEGGIRDTQHMVPRCVPWCVPW